MKSASFLYFIIIILVSCSPKSDVPGYSKSRKGFHYKLHTIGESNQKAQTSDYITADIRYYTINDSLFFEGRRKIRLDKPSYEGSIEDCFSMLRTDESASFLIVAKPFFNKTLGSDLPGFIDDEELIRIYIHLIEIQTVKEFENEKIAFLNWIEDFGDYEKEILNQFLKEGKVNVQPTNSGLIYLPVKTNQNNKIVIGDTITINYEGTFLNGKFFDSTKRRKQPFQFVYGTEWQVVEGLEEGLSMMGEGEKGIFILPSELAFGTSGSSTGIIPPFTSLIFEVEILNVKSGNKVK